MLAALLLAALCGCAKAPQTTPADTEAPAGTEAPADTEAPQSTRPPAEVTRGSLLPDRPADEDDGEWAKYSDVTAEELRGYIEKRVSEGFGLVGDAEGGGAKLLRRADAWIEISDDGEAGGECSVRISLASHEGGMDAEAALRAIGAEVSADNRIWTHGANAVRHAEAVIDITPAGFREATGAQLFRAQLGMEPDPGAEVPIFTTAVFIAAGERAMEILYACAAAADIDGDGADEAIIMGCGPTKGFFSVILEAFGVNGGALESEALAGHVMERGITSLAVHGGKPYFVWEKAPAGPLEFEMYLDYDEILIMDRGELPDHEVMAHFDW